jgi:prevent-host-death family protein
MTMTKRKEKVVPAGEFKAKCLALLDQVEAGRRSFIITKRGRPVARVVPLPTVQSGSLRGTLLHEEDLLAPIPATWDALA